jgi:monoamine oxidase
MRIPQSHDYTRHYIAACALSLRHFVTSHDESRCFYYLREVARSIAARKDILDRYDISVQERKIASSLGAPSIFGYHLSNVLKSLTTTDIAALSGEIPLTDRAAELDRLSLGEFLDQHVECKDTKELIGAVSGLEVWWDIALTMFIRDELAENGEGLEEIVGGTDLLPSTLVKTSRLIEDGNLELNREVTSISLEGDRVRLGVQKVETRKVKTDEGEVWGVIKVEPPKEEVADYVICTIPFSVLRGMKLEKLSHHKMSAIRNLHYESSTKVLLNCKERFWESQLGIYGGASLSDQITRATYYPSDHAPPFVRSPLPESAPSTPDEGPIFRGLFTRSIPDEKQQSKRPLMKSGEEKPAGPGVLVGSYNWGRDARRLGTLLPLERAETVVRVLRNFPGHGKIDEHLDRSQDWYETMCWDEYPWSRGAFCFMKPNDLRYYYHAAIAPEGNLHFAGEHCSLDQAWIQGAIKSALRAIEEIVKK